MTLAMLKNTDTIKLGRKTANLKEQGKNKRFESYISVFFDLVYRRIAEFRLVIDTI